MNQGKFNGRYVMSHGALNNQNYNSNNKLKYGGESLPLKSKSEPVLSDFGYWLLDTVGDFFGCNDLSGIVEGVVK